MNTAKKKDKKMALEISHLDENRVEGTLDGALAFQLLRQGEMIVAQINNWRRELAHRSVLSASEMRCCAYEALARYREAQRFGEAG